MNYVGNPNFGPTLGSNLESLDLRAMYVYLSIHLSLESMEALQETDCRIRSRSLWYMEP